ncbi:LNS2 domain-containing protein [Brumimicrobium mesophilum]|uniref:LNS2 domain-containing protein n=1 Tax=Brumimicrobium mesophilum TaxID=392717 RepID=UPI000D14226B|nr:phosphoheptose isomerase [Brumimicrobium mesophilum]
MSDKKNTELKELLDEKGNKISPQLGDDVKNYLIDIDGTITEDVPNEEPERMSTCEPYLDALETLNKWYDEGHIITFFTSRTLEHKEVTEKWLDKHGFKYSSVLYEKPRGGNYHWIDNHLVKATKFNGKFTDLVNREHTIEVFNDK